MCTNFFETGVVLSHKCQQKCSYCCVSQIRRVITHQRNMGAKIKLSGLGIAAVISSQWGENLIQNV